MRRLAVFAAVLVAVLAPAVLGCWVILTGSALLGLAVAATSPVAIVAGIAFTICADATRNRRTAASWDKDAASLNTPAPPAAEPERPAFAVSAAGEAQRLNEAGCTEIGLVAAFAVVTFAAYYLVAALFPGVVA